MIYSVYIRVEEMEKFETGRPVEFTNENYFVKYADYVRINADPAELEFISVEDKRVAGEKKWFVKKII